MTQTKQPPETQEDIRQQAMHQLAIIGGQLNTEDDIVFQGQKFVIPETVPNLVEAIKFLDARMKDEEEEYAISRTFPYRPHDGARATMLAIREAFGFSQGKAIYTFFGKNPPQFIDIPVGVNETEQVPWGAMQLPGLQGAVLYLGTDHDPELGTVFNVNVEAPKKYRFVIQGLFKLIERNLREHSIYRGKAVDGAANPQFLDLSGVDPANVVYTQQVLQQFQANVWSPIRHADVLAKLGQPGKRSVLLEGPYGTGKSLGAYLTALVAVENNWTFILCRPGKDDLGQTLQTARMYQPAVVFFEDLDTIAEPGTISKVLDMFDGITTKGLKMLVVLTTNHVEQIHKGMIRPGRLDAVIHIGDMDRPGIQRLAERVLGNALDHDIDWGAVHSAMEGYVPAFVKEAFDRAIRYNIAANNGSLGKIGTVDLIGAAEGLRPQLELMLGASDAGVLPTLDQALKTMVSEAVTGVALHKPVGEGYPLSDGGHIGNLVGSNEN
jgi:transitional endoplasmic reticulum ATPase